MLLFSSQFCLIATDIEVDDNTQEVEDITEDDDLIDEEIATETAALSEKQTSKVRRSARRKRPREGKTF